MEEIPPLNECVRCNREFKGWVDDPDVEFICHECKEKEEGELND